MDLYQLEQTCSMQELSINKESDISDRNAFLRMLRSECPDDNGEGDGDEYDPEYDTLYSLRCIIYNCQNRKFEPHLHKLGFRKKFSYIGNNNGPDGKKVTINVWLLKLTNKLRKEIRKI